MISTQVAIQKLVDGLCELSNESHRTLYRDALESLVRLAHVEKIEEIRNDYMICMNPQPHAAAHDPAKQTS